MCIGILVLLQHTIGSCSIIGASLSEPHHMGSTVKSVFLLACLLVCNVKIPVYGRKPFKCKPTLHQTLQALHKTRGVLTIARESLNANHRRVYTIQVLTIIY